MSAIRDEVRIDAPATIVYEALTRQAGYRGWWNAAGEVEERVGGRIDEMKPSSEVRWTCVAHDMPSWVGTAGPATRPSRWPRAGGTSSVA